jgi:hypothetical protein
MDQKQLNDAIAHAFRRADDPWPRTLRPGNPWPVPPGIVGAIVGAIVGTIRAQQQQNES